MASAVARQLVFDLARAPGFDRDDFLVSTANEAAVSAIQAWPEWPGRTLLVVGPPGSGKSHLAAIWAADSAATIVAAGGQILSSLWEGGGRSVLLEDCDRAAFAEPAFFHALNLARETSGWLLMTASNGPGSWGVKTPDLLSRLRSCTTATIRPPDGELIKAVLLKLFADRQILIDEDVVSYAARHCEQSLDAVNRFVSTVDEAALATGRRITRPLASATLARLQADEPIEPYGPT